MIRLELTNKSKSSYTHLLPQLPQRELLHALIMVLFIFAQLIHHSMHIDSTDSYFLFGSLNHFDLKLCLQLIINGSCKLVLYFYK